MTVQDAPAPGPIGCRGDPAHLAPLRLARCCRVRRGRPASGRVDQPVSGHAPGHADRGVPIGRRCRRVLPCPERPACHARALAAFACLGAGAPARHRCQAPGGEHGDTRGLRAALDRVDGGAEAARLDDELYCADSDRCRLLALQSSLRRTLALGPERIWHSRAQALRQLCAAVGTQGLQATTALGLGERQLERRCRAYLGMTPKQLQRITRLHGLLAAAVQLQRVPDADAALAAGFFDQSHLARDTRLLTGSSLCALLREVHAGGAWWALGTQRLLVRHGG